MPWERALKPDVAGGTREVTLVLNGAVGIVMSLAEPDRRHRTRNRTYGAVEEDLEPPPTRLQFTARNTEQRSEEGT